MEVSTETTKLEQAKKLAEKKTKTGHLQAVGESEDRRLSRQITDAHHILAS